MDEDFDESSFFQSFYFRDDEHQLGIGIPKIDEDIHHQELLYHLGLNQRKFDKIKDVAPFQCTICFEKFIIAPSLARNLINHFKNNHLESIINANNNLESRISINESTQVAENNKTKKEETSNEPEKSSDSLQDIQEIRLLDHIDIEIIDKYSKYELISNDNGVKQLKCKVCQALYNTKQSFMKHYKSHKDAKVRNYECPECNRKFITSSHLKQHKERHKEPKFRCDECGTKFFRRNDYRNHMLKKHNKKLSNQIHPSCPECNDRFANEEFLKHHTNSKTQNTCHACNISFCSKKLLFVHKFHVHKISDDETFQMCLTCNKAIMKVSLREHEKDHKNEEAGYFACNICRKSFKSKWLIHKHLQDHKKIKIKLNCKMCGLHFDFLRELRAHVLTHEEKSVDIATNTASELMENDLPQCFDCKTKFMSLEFLEKHQKNRMSIVCNLCDSSSFCSKKLLFMHKHTSHDLNEDDEFIVCNLCNVVKSKKTIAGHFALAHQKDVNNKETILKCPHCTKKFKTKTRLDTHVLKHTTEASYSCQVCGKIFYQQSRRRYHMKMYHKVVYPCEICGMALKSENELKNHLINHELESGLKCEICNRLFSTRNNLKNHHLSFHSTENNFKCNLCIKSFSVKRSLDEHMKRCH